MIDASRPPVLLLHGLWMHAPALHWLANGLSAAGFAAHPMGYWSLLEDTESATTHIARTLARMPGAHVVAHSLGGLLALQAVRQVAGFAGRVVCLGSPLGGSGAAGAVVAHVPGGRQLMGSHLPLLEAGAEVLPEGVEVGMVAGNRPHGLGGLIARFEGEHDGTVAVEETRVDGLADHVVLDASHSGLIFSREVAEQAAHFLLEGRFMHAAHGAARAAIG